MESMVPERQPAPPPPHPVNSVIIYQQTLAPPRCAEELIDGYAKLQLAPVNSRQIAARPALEKSPQAARLRHVDAS
jgi:hypothetical protein